jgi:hypothetical protein
MEFRCKVCKHKGETTSKSSTSDFSSEYDIHISESLILNLKKKIGSGAFGDVYHGNLYFII